MEFWNIVYFLKPTYQNLFRLVFSLHLFLSLFSVIFYFIYPMMLNVFSFLIIVHFLHQLQGWHFFNFLIQFHIKFHIFLNFIIIIQFLIFMTTLLVLRFHGMQEKNLLHYSWRENFNCIMLIMFKLNYTQQRSEHIGYSEDFPEALRDYFETNEFIGSIQKCNLQTKLYLCYFFQAFKKVLYAILLHLC